MSKPLPKTDRRNVSHKLQELPSTYTPGFVQTLDQRTEIARLLRERYAGIACDLGGLAQLSGIKASLLERFCFLEATLAKLEADMAKAPDAKTASEVMGRWIQACNALLGIGKTLGLERQMKAVDLKAYVQSSSGEMAT
jgi:hypothetical protein